MQSGGFLKSHIRIVLFIMFLAGVAWAVPPEGDAAAKLGDYQKADQIYRAAKPTDPADARRLLLRRLAVAQARNDAATAAQVSEQLEKALQSVDDPEVAMRMHLIRMAMAYRAFDVSGALGAMNRARPLAQKLAAGGDPGGALGLAECNSLAYLSSLLVNGQPEPTAYSKACQQAYAPAFQVPATAARPLWPLDVVRTTYWSRLWVLVAGQYEYLAFRKNDSIVYNAWYNAATGISNYAATSYYQQYQITNDPEWGLAALHLILEWAEAFPLAILDTNTFETAGQQIEQLPEFQEALYLRGRYQRASARWYLFARKDPAAALEHYQQSAAWFEKGGYVMDAMDVWSETAYLYLLDDVPKPGWEATVKENLSKLMARSQKIDYPLGRYFGQGFTGVLAARKGSPAEAEKQLSSALQSGLEWAVMATPRARIEFLSKPEMKLFSDTLLELLVKQERSQDALEWTRRLSAEAETSGLDLNRVNRSPSTDQALKTISESRRERGELQAQLQSAQSKGDSTLAGKLQGQLAGNRAEFQKTVNQLRQQDPDFERLLSVRPSSFSKLQSSLPPEEVLVAFYPAEDKTLLFAVTKDDIKIFSTSLGRDKMTAAVSTLRAEIVKLSRVDSSVSNELYEGLVAPLDSMLEHHSVLTVIPSGVLYYLPFSALTDKQGRPLCQRVTLNVMTATEMPEIARFNGNPPPTTLLALANPDGSLPGASQEVHQLSALFQKSRTYEGKEATEDKVDGKSQVMHLATHGILNSDDVNESYLLMSDGKLTTGKIYGLDLQNVDLVTLSACRTAVGERNPGSEVATLAQAFSIAGSHSVLASLWPVDDEATAHLMVEFYKGLLAGKSKAESLRDAQMAVRAEKRWQHPYYWSAFELFGDWH